MFICNSVTVFVALISVLSAVGICERCRVERGGVYFLIAHILGSRFGGSLGLLYCFGQVILMHCYNMCSYMYKRINILGRWMCVKCTRFW